MIGRQVPLFASHLCTRTCCFFFDIIITLIFQRISDVNLQFHVKQIKTNGTSSGWGVLASFKINEKIKKVSDCGPARGDHRDIVLHVTQATVARGDPCGRTQVELSGAARLRRRAGTSTWARRSCRWVSSHGYMAVAGVCWWER